MPVLDPHPVYFPEAVQSILQQTFSDWELIIVEEPSSGPAVKDLLPDKSDPRIRVQTHPHRTSLVQQRNRGLEQARGELIAWLDADDVAEPHRLAEQVAFLDRHPEIAVLGSQIKIIDASGGLIGVRRYPLSHEEIVRCLRRFSPLAQPAVMCRRAGVVEAGGYQYEQFPVTEDYELWCRMAQRGYRFANHPGALLRYRLHGSASKARLVRPLLLSTMEIKRRYFQGQFDWGDRLRLWGERLLLLLPPTWVYRLFVWHAVKPVPHSAVRSATPEKAEEKLA
jgi:glycosyltransferase involved in cell wall biosynthesis